MQKMFMANLTWLLLTAIYVACVWSGSANAAEYDISIPRVPPGELAVVKVLKNPFPVSSANIAKGKAIYDRKGFCFACHGNDGNGKGTNPASQELDPKPTNFTNPEFHRVRTPGEMFWAIDNGVPGTAMISFTTKWRVTEKIVERTTIPDGVVTKERIIEKIAAPGEITKEEAWLAVLYLQSLVRTP